jgi:hypothetical protein
MLLQPKASRAPSARRPAGAGWSLRLAWGALLLLLAAGVPMFVCMPPWADVTHYDLCARTVLWGGVHYRDSFDTNLPGIVWAHMAVRSLLGWQYETLRAVDLGLVGGTIALLLGWLARAGRPAGVRAWTAVALFGFYLGTTEICHCQRDTWVLFLALVALSLRGRQTARLAEGVRGAAAAAAWSLAEGFLWGLAFWIKPHVAVPAAACWLVSTAQLWRTRAVPAHRLAADTAGLLAGGLAAGGLGIAWLLGTGTWPYFWDVMLGWNPEYTAFSTNADARQLGLVTWWRTYLPWSCVHLAVVPVAAGVLWREVVRRPPASASRPGPLALLAGLYLGWLAQATLLQYSHDYVMAPTVLLAVPLIVAGVRLRGQPSTGGRLLATAAALALTLFLALALALHPLLRFNRLAVWPRCWTEGSTPGVRDSLALEHAYVNGIVDWTDLGHVADFLRAQHVADGEVLCFDDNTHPLYLDLGLRPAGRFFQFTILLEAFPRHREAVRRELEAAHPRFVVSDLVVTGMRLEPLRKHGLGPVSALPPGFPSDLAGCYPWTEPVLYRSGRYLVHRTDGRVGKLCVP